MASRSRFKVQKVLSDYPDFEPCKDLDRLWCKYCQKVLKIEICRLNYRLDAHMKTDVHEKNKNLYLRGQRKLQSFLGDNFDGTHDIAQSFYKKLAELFFTVNIPLYKLEVPQFKKFIEDELKKICPARSTVRGYLSQIYDEKMQKLRSYIGEADVFFVVDETTDLKGRYVLNVLVGRLDGRPCKPLLLSTKFLLSTGHLKIMDAFNEAAIDLWPNGLKRDKVRLIVTDQGPNILAAFKRLKLLYPNMLYVTCILHCISLVCDQIRMMHPLTDELIAKMKEIFRISPGRLSDFMEFARTTVPPKPILTRWGTWIESALFWSENFSKTKEFVLALDGDAATIVRARELVDQQELEDELIAVLEHEYLIDIIRDLQSEEMKVSDQLHKFKIVESKVEGIALAKLKSSIEKNADFNYFVDLDKQEFDLRRSLKYAPLVSSSVERSFSSFKNLLNSNRASMTEETIAKQLFVYYNQELN